MPTIVKSVPHGTIVHKSNYQPQDFYHDSVDEGSLSINFGDGHLLMKHWYFEGIRIGYSESMVKEPVPVEWKGDMELVQLIFNLGGNNTFERTVFGKTFHFNQLQHIAFYSNGFEGIIHNTSGYQRSLVIQFDKQVFLKLIEGTTDQLKRMGEAIAKGQPVKIAPHHLYIDLRLQRVIQEILQCQYAGHMKKLFLYAKCLEILLLQAEAFESYEKKKVLYCKYEADQEKIVYARDYLIQHVKQPPTIPELARIVGINEFKLKKGFRELFNQSIFGYLSEYRLETARVALLENQKTISELAYELGYSSPQHFSMSFKKQFGITPSQTSGKAGYI